jgi:biotin carboxyl carrier protein
MKAIVNGGDVRVIEATAEGWKINGELQSADLRELQTGRYHIISGNKSMTVEVLTSDLVAKKHVLKVNGAVIEVQLRDQYDELLQALGMDIAAGKKAGDLKAPMPGLVVDVAVTEGQAVEKGDTLIVLEAMKMENSLKATGSATVKKINIQKGNTVEKNQVLIQFA